MAAERLAHVACLALIDIAEVRARMRRFGAPFGRRGPRAAEPSLQVGKLKTYKYYEQIEKKGGLPPPKS